MNETIEKLIKKIDDLELEIDNWSPDESDYEDSYDDMLDECYGEMFNISASRILSECDPIQYNCGLSDYVDSLELEPDDLQQELEDLKVDLEIEIDSDIEILEDEIENLDDDECEEAIYYKGQIEQLEELRK